MPIPPIKLSSNLLISVGNIQKKKHTHTTQPHTHKTENKNQTTIIERDFRRRRKLRHTDTCAPNTYNRRAFLRIDSRAGEVAEHHHRLFLPGGEWSWWKVGQSRGNDFDIETTKSGANESAGWSLWGLGHLLFMCLHCISGSLGWSDVFEGSVKIIVDYDGVIIDHRSRFDCLAFLILIRIGNFLKWTLYGLCLIMILYRIWKLFFFNYVLYVMIDTNYQLMDKLLFGMVSILSSLRITFSCV